MFGLRPFRIFRLFGIDVFLDWSWFILAFFRIKYLHFAEYSSPIWYAAEFVGLFAIVLTHEFGHTLACRQVGGKALRIILWPLGGIAYVSPPQRPGAVLWSIAAGPLVNVVLFPIFSGIVLVARATGWPDALPNLYTLLTSLWGINLGLLVFNMLPVYPLDGGQILQSLLWFVIGRANSLFVSVILGVAGVVVFGFLALLELISGERLSAGLLLFMDAFLALNCWGGLRQALALSKLEKAPRRPEFTCPECHESPPIGEFWLCSRCRKPFDTFLTHAMCPHCNAEYPVTGCPFCRTARPFADWFGGRAPAPSQQAPPPV
jgi:Zn-dependent protease